MTFKIDLTLECQLIEEHLKKQILVYSQQESAATVNLVVVGFRFDNPSWLCIFFDERENATNDGEWTMHIEDSELELTQCSNALSQEDSIVLYSANGIELTIDYEIMSEHYDFVGNAIKEIICKLRMEGQFRPLNTVPDCQIVLEEFDGYYAWSGSLDPR